MNHDEPSFYNGRQVGAAITLASTGNYSCCESSDSNAATSICGTNDARTVYAILTTSNAKCAL